jgi:hypothetical protein
MISSHYKQISMEDGGVDRNVIDCWQHQLSQMADFPPLLTSLVFDLTLVTQPMLQCRLNSTKLTSMNFYIQI